MSSRRKKPPAHGPEPKPEPKPQIDPAFSRVLAAFIGVPKVKSGKLMASFGLRVNGRIFAMQVGGQLVVKLPKARVDALVEAGTGGRFDPRGNGSLMNEWVVVGPGQAEWVALSKEAHAFVKELK